MRRSSTTARDAADAGSIARPFVSVEVTMRDRDHAGGESGVWNHYLNSPMNRCVFMQRDQRLAR